MFRNKINILVLFIVAGISIVSFQNCAQQGFQSLMKVAQSVDHFALLQNTQDEDSGKPQVLVFNAVDSIGPWADIAINPSTGHLAMIDDVASQFCKPDCPSGNLQIGISYIANLLDTPQDRVLRELTALIKGAKAHGFYFLIHTNHEWVITKDANPFEVPTAEWAEYSDWGKPLENFYITWGNPFPEIGLKPNFKSPAVRARASKDIAVLAKFVREQIFTDPELKELFLGIDSGWETEVTPWISPKRMANGFDEIGQQGPLGFAALSLMGYSKDKPPADFQAELANIVRDYVKFIANRYESEGIPSSKIYSHTLINSEPGRQKVNPVDAAKLSNIRLGASIYDYNTFDPKLIQDNLINDKWAIVETGIDFAAQYLSHPTEIPPSFINIYNWGNDFHDKPARIEQFAKFFNDPNRQSPVVLKGTVAGLSSTFDLSGWACQVGSKMPVDIQIKAITPNDSEVLIATTRDSNVVARTPADSVTHQVCGLDTRSSSPANLRFAINIPESVREKHSDSFLKIYALRGGKSILISQKQFRLPIFKEPNSEGYDVIVVAGQSNAAGYGLGDYTADRSQDQRIFQLERTSKNIIQATEPLQNHDLIQNKDTMNGRIGFAMTFARRYAQTTSRNILLVPAALGGTFISQWQPDQLLYLNMKEHITTALTKPGSKIVAFLWHQGEGDVGLLLGNKTTQDIYKNSLQVVFNTLRSDFSKQGVFPIILGKMVPKWPKYQPNLPEKLQIEQAMVDVSLSLPNIQLVSSEGLVSNKPDGVDGTDDIIHFSGSSQVIFGGRYFEAFMSSKQPTDPRIAYTEAVKKAYREIFNREAEPAGLAYYVDLMMKGKTESEVRILLQESVEGKCRGSGGTMSNGACICPTGSSLTGGICKVDTKICVPNSTQLCPIENGEGKKTCNSSGMAYGSCVATSCNSGYLLSSSGICQVQVAQCERLQSKIAVSTPRVEKLKFVYCLVLKREADAPGLQHHLGTSATIAETIVHFISSPEMNNKFYGGQNYTTVSVDVFVESLYKHILNRASDAGKTHWVNEINSGRATREQVIKSFFDSKEIPNRFGDLLGQ